MSAAPLYEHPDGMGSVRVMPEQNVILVTNERDGTAARVVIGLDGLRDLAARLAAVASVTGEGA